MITYIHAIFFLYVMCVRHSFRALHTKSWRTVLEARSKRRARLDEIDRTLQLSINCDTSVVVGGGIRDS